MSILGLSTPTRDPQNPSDPELPEPKPSDPRREVVGGGSQRLKTDADGSDGGSPSPKTEPPDPTG